MEKKNIFSQKLINWFELNKRDLPWRHTKNPYFIWLSEIILQQTRVAQGLPYYQKFTEKFPTVKKLASASEHDILKLWQGLGYYARARNLHETAKIICEKYDGKFPDNYEQILELKGVGRYTAGAISSFAYDLPYPAVDGNVKRVLSRIFGIAETNPQKAEKFFYSLAQKLLDEKNSSGFNQAIMEFGAICCTALNPLCEDCIFRSECVALKLGTIYGFPVKTKKVKQKSRFFYYLFIENGDNVFIRKRTGNDIWKNLYEFPKIESLSRLSTIAIINSNEWHSIFKGAKVTILSESKTYKHILSHQVIFARFLKISITKKPRQFPRTFLRIQKSDLNTYPIPRLIEKYLCE